MFVRYTASVIIFYTVLIFSGNGFRVFSFSVRVLDL